MDRVPYEVTQDILSHLSYQDILNYCSVNTNAQIICNDRIFWLGILDRDFIKLDQNGIVHIPSLYVMKYGTRTESGQNMYKRWVQNHITNVLEIKVSPTYENPDIIHFVLDTYNMNESELSKVKMQMYYAITTGNLNALKSWIVRGMFPNRAMIRTSYKLHHNTRRWLFQQNIFPDTPNKEYFEFFAKQKIFPSREAANHAIRTHDADGLEWLLEHKIYPNQASDNYIFDTRTLELLAKYRLIPRYNLRDFIQCTN